MIFRNIVLISVLTLSSSCTPAKVKTAKCYNSSGELSSDFARKETIRHLGKLPKWGLRTDGVRLNGEEIRNIDETDLNLLPNGLSIIDGEHFDFAYVSGDVSWKFTLALYNSCYSHLGYSIMKVE